MGPYEDDDDDEVDSDDELDQDKNASGGAQPVASSQSWDVSYKASKHLANYHGQPLYKGLVTGTNDIGEIRAQFHLVADGQDQFNTPLGALRDSLAAQDLVGLDSSDSDMDSLPDLVSIEQPFRVGNSGAKRYRSTTAPEP